MNFFKDPKYKSIRIILLLIIIVGAGWFTYSNMQLSDSNQGRVIKQDSMIPVPVSDSKTGVTPSPATEQKALDMLNVALVEGEQPAKVGVGEFVLSRENGLTKLMGKLSIPEQRKYYLDYLGFLKDTKQSIVFYNKSRRTFEKVITPEDPNYSSDMNNFMEKISTDEGSVESLAYSPYPIDIGTDHVTVLWIINITW